MYDDSGLKLCVWGQLQHLFHLCILRTIADMLSVFYKGLLNSVKDTLLNNFEKIVTAEKYFVHCCILLI